MPPRITSVSDHLRPPHSSSAPALLVASLPLAPAAADSAQHRHCSCPLIFHPPMCCFDFCLCPLRLYVRQCNTTPSPWWLLCLQWSVLLTTRTAELLSGLIANFSRLCVTRYVMLEHLCASITPLHPRSRAERRYETLSHYTVLFPFLRLLPLPPANVSK